MNRRWTDSLYALGLVIALLGGALLWSTIHGTAQKNSELICALGSAISQNRIEQRGEENLKEFRRRVRITRQFVAKLNELDDCSAKSPNAVHLKRKDREKLRQDRRKRQGGDASSNAPSGSSQPGPPSSGPPSGGNGGHPGPPGNPPTPPTPPDPPRPLAPVLDPVCDLTNPVLPLPAICR